MTARSGRADANRGRQFHPQSLFRRRWLASSGSMSLRRQPALPSMAQAHPRSAGRPPQRHQARRWPPQCRRQPTPLPGCQPAILQSARFALLTHRSQQSLCCPLAAPAPSRSARWDQQLAPRWPDLSEHQSPTQQRVRRPRLRRSHSTTRPLRDCQVRAPRPALRRRDLSARNRVHHDHSQTVAPNWPRTAHPRRHPSPFQRARSSPHATGSLATSPMLARVPVPWCSSARRLAPDRHCARV